MLPLPWVEDKYTERSSRKGKTRFPCPRCRKSYTTKSAVTAHFKYDCGKPPRFECPYCGKLSKKKFNIQDHIRHKHPSKPVICNTLFWDNHGLSSSQRDDIVILSFHTDNKFLRNLVATIFLPRKFGKLIFKIPFPSPSLSLSFYWESETNSEKFFRHSRTCILVPFLEDSFHRIFIILENEIVPRSPKEFFGNF